MDLTILALLAVHFVGDFPLQGLLPGNVATRKSHSWPALLLHTSTYSLLFWIGWGWQFALITFLAHTLTDALTSQLTTRWWFMPVQAISDKDIAWEKWALITYKWTHFTRLEPVKRTLFFSTIGFDQLLHAAQLILTLRLLR